MKLSPDPYVSYKIFQGRVLNEYDKMRDEYGLVKIDATESIHQQQIKFRQLVKEVLLKKGIELNEE